jgi:hypothetical protein
MVLFAAVVLDIICGVGLLTFRRLHEAISCCRNIYIN